MPLLPFTHFCFDSARRVTFVAFLFLAVSLDSNIKRFNHAFMNSRSYQSAPFEVTRWAAVIAVLAALTYLIYLLVDPFNNNIIKPDHAAMSAIDWVIYGSPIVLLAVMTISAFAPRVVILLHITAIAAACSIPVVLLDSRNQQLAFLLAPICFWVLMYFHAFALRRQQHRLASQPEEKESGPYRITSEIDCIFCGYNLNHLMSDGLCPECGRAVTPSLSPERFSLQQPHWFFLVHQGLRFFAVGTLIQSAVDLLFEYTKTFGWHPEYAMYLFFLATTLQLIGIWMMTAKGRIRGDNRGRIARILIRVLATIYTALYWLFLLSFMLEKLAEARKINPDWAFSFPNLASQFETVETVVYAFLLWHIALYVYILATRMPSRRTGIYALLGGFAVLASAGFSTLLPIMHQCLMQFLPSVGDNVGDIVEAGVEQIAAFYMAIFLFAFSIFFWRYYKRLSTRSEHALS